MTTAQHRQFDQGFNQDETPILLPEGYVYNSRNMLYDKIGVARKRGGITGLGSTTTYNADHIGALTSDAGAVQLYAGGTGDLKAINSSTGAMTDLLLGGGYTTATNPNGGRPFLHHGFLIWPFYSTTSSDYLPVSVAGANGSKAGRAFTVLGLTGVIVSAGDNRVLCNAADNPLTLMQVGQIFVATLPAGVYVGRVTELLSTTSFTVYPTPPFGAVANSAYTLNAYDPFFGGGHPVNNNVYLSCKVGMSFQGRVCLGNIGRVTNTPLRQEVYPRRFAFSSTLLEGDIFAGASPVGGATFITADGFPALNYFDIPVHEEITAMAPTGFGDAVIFSGFRAFRLTGNLSTQYGTQQSITWSPREIPNSVGCMSERSLQRTPRGLIFAHDSGIYSTDGAAMRPLMYKRVANYWNSLVKGTNFVIYGSALIRGNHYYICGISASVPWALLVNLDTLAWSKLSGKAATPASFLINSAVQDPALASRTWGLKWFGQGSAISMTGGQLVKLDDLFSPTSANRADSDTTTVSFEVITKPYAEDSPTTQKMWQDATIEYRNLGGAAVTVHPDWEINPADMAAGGQAYYLPRQDAYTITGATNATPIVVTCGAHNIKQDTWVLITGVTGNTNANGKWRVQAVSGTTVTLMGTTGNGAYVSGGTIQNVDSRDINLRSDTLQEGLGTAISYRINDTDAGSPGSDEFELYAITHSYDVRDAHVE